MRLVIDTNVFISGVFFSGPPYEILDGWRRGRIEMIVSPEIVDEYRRVGHKLATEFPGVELEPLAELVTLRATSVDALPLKEQVCSDPNDDKFLACAIASRTKTICSGDNALLRVSGYKGITILKPKDFLVRHLSKKP